MGCNPCCCFSLKDSAITVGIWTLIYSLASLFLFGWQTGVLSNCRSVTMSQSNLQCEWNCPCVGASTARTASIIEGKRLILNMGRRVFSIAQLGIMGWQMAAIKYERDRAANTLLPNYNTYGRFDIPSYYESYWQSPEERYYTGLFVIQILCLISAFFLLFASVAMIYGVHTWSRYLVWPWFPCMISSILTSLAYCIMWWAGDVRDYWMALTILEIIGVFINIYATVVVMMYYRRINTTTDQYEGKDRNVRYRINRQGYSSRRDLLDSYDHGINRSPEQIIKSPYQNYNTTTVVQYPIAATVQYPPYSPSGVPQTPLPIPTHYAPHSPPYPTNPIELNYQREPKIRLKYEDEDPVAHWVKNQQKDPADPISEPIADSKQVFASTYPIKHSKSVPSLNGGTLVSHKDCRHGKHHRSSSRQRRSRSRHAPSTTIYSESESETERDLRRNHRDGSRRREKSRSRYAESIETETTESRRKENYRHRKDDERKKHLDREERGSKRKHKHHHDRDKRRNKDDGGDEKHRRHRTEDIREEQGNSEAPPDGIFPLSGGISIPQHIVIPPSNGERGPDGKPLPQKFQINSEITINYDHNQKQQHIDDSQQRRYQGAIQSNV